MGWDLGCSGIHPHAKGCAPMEQHCGTTHAGERWPGARVPSRWDRWLLHLPASTCTGDAPVAKPVSLPEQHRWDAGAGGDIGAFPAALAGRCRSLGTRLCPPGVLPSPQPKHRWPRGCLVLPTSSGACWAVDFAPLPPAVWWLGDGDSSEEGTRVTPKLPKTPCWRRGPQPCAGAAAPNLLLLQGAAGSGDQGTPLGWAAGSRFPSALRDFS